MNNKISRRSFLLGLGAASAAALLAACGPAASSSPAAGPSSVPVGTAQPEAASDPASAAAQTGAVGGHKVLVAYYSATGTTESVANTLASALGADVLELEPAQPYTTEDLRWTNENSRVSREHNDPDRQVELAVVTPEGFDAYDVVILGYPIWWQNASWVVDGFVRGNDFTGKTVLPFCTSASSPFGESGANLAAMAGTGTWLDGARFTARSTLDDVPASWLELLEG